MESNLPLGKVWLETCRIVELETLVLVIAMNVLHLLYILLGSTQKEGKYCGKGLKIKSFFAFSLGSCPLVACPMPSCPGQPLLSLHQLLLYAQDIFLCLFQRRKDIYC